MLQLKRDNMQVIFEIKHKFDIAEIELQETEIKSETAQKIKEIDAYQHQNCKIIHAENIKALAESKAKSRAAEITGQAKAYADSKRLEADN